MSRYHCAYLAVTLFVEAAGKKRVTELAAKHGLPEDEIRAMAEFDPTKTDKFLSWIAAQVANDEVSLPADGPELKAVLEDFMRKGRLLEKQDINSYWYRLLKVRLSETESKGEAYRAKVKGGQEVIYDESPWKVIRITTPEAADKLCRPEWCIKDRKYWDEYDLGPGAPAYLVLKDGKKYACMVPHRSELKGTDDKPLEPTKEFGELLRKLAPQLKIIWDEDFVPFLHMMPDKEIIADPEMAFMYAEHVVKGRWPKGEATIARDPHWATLYALHVIKKRFPKGEPAIAREPDFAHMYAREVVRGRFPEGEAAISDSKWAFDYAMNIVKGRWPEGESAIASRGVQYEVEKYGKLIGDPDWLDKRLKAASAKHRPSRYHRTRRMISRMASGKRSAGTIEPWQMTGDSPEYAAMSIDELDRAAFGFSGEDIESLHPGQLRIKWRDDWENAVYEQKHSGLSDKEWARTIDLSEPIDVVFENGRFYVDDGHHRFYAAKILDKELTVTVEIKDKPHRAIVEKALREGKPVPPEVLKEYPDLSAKRALARRNPLVRSAHA